jgi:hypothetical protein
MSKPHENIRVQISHLLKDLLRDVLRERMKVSRDLRTVTLMRILDSPEKIILIMPQEIYVSPFERKSIDMALGRLASFDFKSSEREFDDAVRDALSKYWSVVSKTKFFVTTSWSKWRIYRVSSSGLQLVGEYDYDDAVKIFRTQILTMIDEVKIPPIPENIEILFKHGHEEILNVLHKIFDEVKSDEKVRPLYEAYKNIMSMIYGRADEKFFTDLFMRHTYMHMAVMTSISTALGKTGRVEDMCSGSLLKVDIALPYLNWWRVALNRRGLREMLDEILTDVVQRAGLVDWSLNTAEDVFRVLYEFLVDPSVRRKIGEYYTPIWLVDMIVREFDVKDRIVLDPFCGSGTFLIKTFYRKIEEGEDPDDALGEVVGFDINPLAVAVARAEMLIAFERASGREPEDPPHIYHVDTLASWFGEGSVMMSSLEKLVKKAEIFLKTLVNMGQIRFRRTSDLLKILKDLEKTLTFSIRFSINQCGLDVNCLDEKIMRYLDEGLRRYSNGFVRSILDHFRRASVSRAVAELINSYGGDDVWSVVLMSIYVSMIMRSIKPDIIMTNPPWILTTKYKASYAGNIRRYLQEKLTGMVSADKISDVINGADISVASLGKSIEIAREGVAYIMNRNQLFNHKTSAPAGIVASYAVLKKLLKGRDVDIKLIDFDFDVFGHGIYPAVIIIKRGSR